MTEDLRKSMYELGRAFEAFKEANDQRLRELERKTADPLTERRLERLGNELDRIQTQVKYSPETARTQTNEFDAFALERMDRLADPLTLQKYQAYKQAFGNYIRRNNAGSDVAEIKALSVGSDPDGGFAAPPPISQRIADKITSVSPMRRLASVATIGADALEGVAGDGSEHFGWVGQTGDNREKKAVEHRIATYEQYAEPQATQRLLDDKLFNVEEWLAQKVSERMGYMENEAFITGNGVKKPRGFLTYPAGSSSANAAVIETLHTGTGGAFAHVNPADALITLIYSLKSAYRENAGFMMHRGTLAEARKLKDNHGNYVWQPDYQLRSAGTLLGYPVHENSEMPHFSSPGALGIAFADFKSAYQIVDRAGVRILRDSFTAKPYVKFYTTRRVGGDVVNFHAIKLLKFI